MADDFLARIKTWRDLAETHLTANLKTTVPLVDEVGRAILLSGGKRLRPILFFLSARLAGAEVEPLARFSSIFEFLHCASLLHDDVIDEARTRRSRPTANQRWGNPTAILVGDHLFARSLVLAAETGRPNVIAVLSECIARLAEGQILELHHQRQLETPYPVYLEIIIAKTAVLLAAATQVGAILAEAEPEAETALAAFGLELGIAFQIIDDLLDWTGQEAEVGKPLGQDLREGKATLPWIRALDRADEGTRRELLDRAGRPDLSGADWAWIKATVEELGGLAAAQTEAETYKERAKARLNLFPDSPQRRLALELADYVCRRRA